MRQSRPRLFPSVSSSKVLGMKSQRSWSRGKHKITGNYHTFSEDDLKWILNDKAGENARNEVGNELLISLFCFSRMLTYFPARKPPNYAYVETSHSKTRFLNLRTKNSYFFSGSKGKLFLVFKFLISKLFLILAKFLKIRIPSKVFETSSILFRINGPHHLFLWQRQPAKPRT